MELFFIDVTDLQSFVTVALNNAASGEDTLTNAKLSSLRAVGSGFGYLIYELKADADFHALSKGCRFVWEAMQHTPYLPQYLVRDGLFCPNSRALNKSINSLLHCYAWPILIL